MLHAMPKAATRARKPTINPIPPRNSAMIARNANGARICIIPVNACIVPENPNPPNQPKTFCAPCRKNTTPRTNRSSVKTPSFEVASNRFINDSTRHEPFVQMDHHNPYLLVTGRPFILLSDSGLQPESNPHPYMISRQKQKG